MLIFPAIDLLDGQCVRLTQGNYSEKTVYTDDAVATAQSFEQQGATWLHVVDLNGARSGKMENLEIVERVARSCGLRIELGGGIRSLEAAKAAIDAGVERVVVGSKIIQDPELAKELFRSLGERVVAGLDARHGKVSISGWEETSEMPVEDVARTVQANGASRIILTDISKDGMLSGPNLELLRRVLHVVEIPVIQSGGISSIDDLAQLAKLPGRQAEGAIIGKALYEGVLDLQVAIEKFQAPFEHAVMS